MRTGYEKVDANLFIKVEGGWQRDELRDDRALIVKTERGLAVILGCAHRGVINTLHHARELTGVERIEADRHPGQSIP